MESINNKQREIYQRRGYHEDLLPKEADKKTWKGINYFTLWMGSVHNVPNYVAVGGFFILGLSTLSIMAAIILSAFIIAFVMVMNGAAGSKYGIPFAMILRASYGVRGALFPGILRGCVAAIMWFGLQCYAGSLAFLILIGKLWPQFLTLGGDFNLLGIGLPGLIAFLIFWAVNVAIGLGGGSILNKFTAILNPCIYVVFGGMAIWAISIAGLDNIIAYVPANAITTNNGGFMFLVVINAVVAVWAAPAVSASDFTQNASSFRQQAWGQTLGLVVGYLLFAVASVCILAGASIHYGVDTWNVLDIVQKWDSIFASVFAVLVILMTTISTNATGNIIPAGYQIAAIAPKKLTYKNGVVIASIISLIICPWKLMENQESIYLFLDVIGGILGPVIGVMMAHYFIVMRSEIDLDTLYIEPGNYKYYDNGFNSVAFIVTLFAVLLSLGGKLIEILEPLSRVSWFVGVISAFCLYALLKSRTVVNRQEYT
ncbi:NCS1 nucleoside transporter family [Serratia fonticola]|jgi:allantoin permease|uniref:NCS1 nucleoside transporter family n=1 Tax=Serratia fonticola TaxID=47917 RepID=A0A542BL31_SERFO|nr:putative allantoin permease [Serratia fonticola]TQI79283.1 NCS1 nucleoside transporter family [Serratia fonticola]TQI98692.1 allantoin permease [Serratia fonticola]TVZ68219.1 NCS1 nucleoside transporter family [Serratia fonticola]